MDMSFRVAPGTCDWIAELYRVIQSIKAGTFDSSEVYSQFAYLVVPEVVLAGADGPLPVYLEVGAPDTNNTFSFLSPIVQFYLYTSDGGERGTVLLQANQMDLTFGSLLTVASATDLEKLMFRGDDRVGYLASFSASPDTRDDVLRTWGGNDNIDVRGSGGTDRFYGGNGNDRITILDNDPNFPRGTDAAFFGYGDAGNDWIQGDQNADHLFGGRGNDTLIGQDGNDKVFGGSGNDIMSGLIGNDTLAGGSGADSVGGGRGRDQLTGGNGADVFVFSLNGDTGVFDSGVKRGARDVITDFTQGIDQIRLSAVFNGSLAGIDLIGGDLFTASGQARWTRNGSDTTIFINADNDKAAEMVISVAGVRNLGEDDFLIL